jgi:ABC-type branched-subunit amino acid transport system ATPase component/ABC-type branched-subunit amino acid transport system permease subunit
MRPWRLARPTFTVVVWIGIGLAMPYLIGTGPDKLDQLEYILALMMVASGLNIVLGFAGILFLGPSALVATGAYAAAVAATHTSTLQSLPAMCLISVVAAVILGAIMAIPSLRIGGFYLGMVTLFAALVVPNVAAHMKITGGGSGISLLTDPTFTQHPSGVKLYNVGLLLVAALAGYAWLIKNSRLGRRFGAIMASEELAQSVGIQPYRTKLIAFILSAVPCGIAGAFYVYSQQFISPDSVSATMSITILAGMVIGGGGTILGPLIGTALVGAASQFLGSFEKYQGIVYGAALILVATTLPFGLMGLYRGIGYGIKMRRMRGRETPDLVPTAAPEVPVPTMADASAAPVPPGSTGPSEPTGRAGTVGRGDGSDAAPRGRRQLVVRGVSRRFGGVLALDNVDLTVEQGRVHALVGPNGSGKTTLINLISGFYRVDTGTISLEDHDLHELRAAEIANLGVARTFQTPKMLVGTTVLDNIVVAADKSCGGSLVGTVLHSRRARIADEQSRHRAEAALDRSGLGASAPSFAELMPHGMQRLLEIARAMALEPSFVLLDEPAAGLSPSEVEHLNRSVKAMAASGLGVLIVEHNLPVVFGLADEVTVLHQGRVIAAGTPGSVSSNPEVVRVYLGRQGQPKPDQSSQPAPAASAERRV